MKIIIVGASSGIGEQLAKDLIDQNHKVGITGRRRERLEEIKKYKSDQIEIEDFDVGYTATSTQKLENLTKKLGGLDLLVLSAGTGKENPEMDFQIEKKTINANVTGRTNIIDRSVNFFKKQKHGHIVGITSIMSLRGSGCVTSYSATKAYQSNYLEGIRLNIDKHNLPITVLEVQPGFVNTRMAQGNLFWVCKLPKASSQIIKAIKKKKKHLYVSKRRRLIGWLLKYTSYRLYKKLINSV